MNERWRWIARGPAGGTLESPPAFASRAEAETWLGEHWTALRDAGGTSVTLLRDEDVVYDMSLEEA